MYQTTRTHGILMWRLSEKNCEKFIINRFVIIERRFNHAPDLLGEFHEFYSGFSAAPNCTNGETPTLPQRNE